MAPCSDLKVRYDPGNCFRLEVKIPITPHIFCADPILSFETYTSNIKTIIKINMINVCEASDMNVALNPPNETYMATPKGIKKSEAY